MDPTQQTAQPQTPPVDYDALAKQAGALSSSNQSPDYDALAKQAGAVSSVAPTGNGQPQPTKPPTPDQIASTSNVQGRMVYNLHDGRQVYGNGIQVGQEGAIPAITQAQKDNLSGLGEESWGIAKGLVTDTGLIGATRNAYDIAVRQLPAAYRAFEKVRNSGGSITDAFSAASEEAKRQADARDVLKQRFNEFQTNPNKAAGRTLADALSAVLMGMGGDAVMEGGGAKVPTETSTPAVETTQPALPTEATHTYDPETGTVKPIQQPTTPREAASPINQQVAKAVSKSGLEPGTRPGMPLSDAEIQPLTQQVLKQVINNAARDSGVNPSNEAGLLRNAASDIGSQVKARSSAAYNALDEASSGRWQRFNDQIKNLQNKSDELVGIDDEKAAEFDAQIDDIKTTRDSLVKQLIDDGKINKDTATKASADWKQSQALTDLDNVIKRNVRPPTTQNPAESIGNMKTLENQLQKMHDSGRLSEAIGNKADDLMRYVQNANDAMTTVKDFKPASPTGQRALGDLVRNNTTEKVGPIRGPRGVTDWNGVLNDFDDLSASQRHEMFGGESGAARRFIQNQAHKQAAINVLTSKNTLKALAVGGLVLGAGGYYLTHE